MIIAEPWVWLHFPKCAGTTISHILRHNFGEREGVAFDPIDPSNVIWHQTIAEREAYDPSFRLGDRKVLCAIRRLPAWLLSRVHYEASRPPHRVATRAMIQRGHFLNRDGRPGQADRTMSRYVTPRVDHFIRAEALAADLKAFFGSSLEVPDRRLNETTIPYVKDLSFWFTPRQLARLYDANPVWAEMERRVYGATLAEEAGGG